MSKKEFPKFQDSNVFEGMTSIRALIEGQKSGINDRRINFVYFDKARAEKYPRELAWLKHRADELGFSLQLTERSEIDALALGNTHGGIIADCSSRTLPELDGIALSENGMFYMLEGIEDPYNFGYALRSLYAMGADGIILSKRNWMSAAGIVARASAGAAELLPLYVAEPLEAAAYFKKNGYRIVCADLRDSTPSYDADLSAPLLTVIGGERRGISRALLDMADVRVRIDYARDFDASLSAASAATMLSYEIFRQNGN